MKQDFQSNIVIGLDIGTKRTKVVLRYPDGTLVPLRDQDTGADTRETAVYRRKNAAGNDEYTYGAAAILDGSVDPKNLAAEFKRTIGDPAKLYFEGTATSKDAWTIWAKHLLDEVQRQAGEKANACVMTFPQYWSDVAKQAAIEATTAAGWMIFPPGLGGQGTGTEPMMAAIAVGNQRELANSGATIAVVDIGGGTTDITIARFKGDELEVLGAHGDEKLGGVDLRNNLAAMILETAKTDQIVKAKDIERLVETHDQRLAFLKTCEDAMPMLSKRDKHRIPITFGQKPGLVTVTRAAYEKSILEPFIARAIACFERAKGKAADKLRPGDSVRLVLVGGPCADPLIAKAITAHTGYEVLKDADPALAIATGAALHASWLRQLRQQGSKKLPGQIRPRERSPFDIGVIVQDGGTPHSYVLIKQGTLSNEIVSQNFGMNHPTMVSGRFVQCDGNDKPESECHPLGVITMENLPVETVRSLRLKVTAFFDDAGMLNAEMVDTVSGRTETLRVAASANKAA